MLDTALLFAAISTDIIIRAVIAVFIHVLFAKLLTLSCRQALSKACSEALPWTPSPFSSVV